MPSLFSKFHASFLLERKYRRKDLNHIVSSISTILELSQAHENVKTTRLRKEMTFSVREAAAVFLWIL